MDNSISFIDIGEKMDTELISKPMFWLTVVVLGLLLILLFVTIIMRGCGFKLNSQWYKRVPVIVKDLTTIVLIPYFLEIFKEDKLGWESWLLVIGGLFMVIWAEWGITREK